MFSTGLKRHARLPRLNHAQAGHGFVGLRLLDFQPLHQLAVLLRRQLPHLGFGARPLVNALLQPLVKQDEAVLLPIQSLDPVSPPPTEQEQCVGERVKLKLLLDDGGKAIDPAPQVGITAGNVDFVCSGEIAQHDFNT